MRKPCPIWHKRAIHFCIISDDSVTVHPSCLTRDLIEGDRGTELECHLNCSSPCSNFSLYKDGEFYRSMQMPKSAIFGNQSLQWNDRGEYQCRATTIENQTIKSDAVKINIQGNLRILICQSYRTEMNFHFIRYLWNGLWVLYPEPLARGYKTINEFHKYRMKWKFISDSFYHMIIPKKINISWQKYLFWENSARKSPWSVVLYATS